MGKMILNGKEYAGSGSEWHEYSTEEKVVGKWFDGKPLYEKTFYYNNVYCGNESQSEMTHDLTNLDVAWVHEALYQDTSSIPKWSNVTSAITYSSSSSKVIAWQVGSSKFYWIGDYANRTTGRSFYVTVRYTKTTDT